MFIKINVSLVEGQVNWNFLQRYVYSEIINVHDNWRLINMSVPINCSKWSALCLHFCLTIKYISAFILVFSLHFSRIWKETHNTLTTDKKLKLFKVKTFHGICFVKYLMSFTVLVSPLHNHCTSLAYGKKYCLGNLPTMCLILARVWVTW